MRYSVLAALLVVCCAGVSAGQSPCAVQGVWIQESATVDGKPEPMGQRRSQKIVTASHWAYVANGPATNDNGFGGGTYRLKGNSYTERLDYFHQPEHLNRDVAATCRTVDGKWYHSFEWPVIEKGKETRRIKIEEVWRKIE